MLNMNVLILSLDSVSRVGFQRLLPKTYDMIVNALSGVVLKGYNIVGDGTPQAFLPILTGKTEREWPSVRKADKDGRYLDEVIRFLWDDFRQAGYVTMFAEDTYFTSMFSYRLRGFKDQPTTHYPLPFYHYTVPKLRILSSWKTLLCSYGEAIWKAFYEYALSLWTEYPRDTLKFALAHSDIMSHDDFNLVQTIDADLANMLRGFASDHLNNTLLLVMSDHGNRFDAIRNSHQGQLEERLPLMRWTPPRSADEEVEFKDRGLSLWNRILAKRSCDNAQIEPHWCACHSWEKLTPDDPVSNAIAHLFVQNVNNVLHPHADICAPLRLSKVISASRLVPHQSVLNVHGSLDENGDMPDLSNAVQLKTATYQLQIQTEPASAKYFFTVEYDYVKQRFGADFSLSQVSRTNAYGEVAHCIQKIDYSLSAYCACLDRV